MAPADAIRSQLAGIPDYSMQRTLRLVADALDAIAAAQSRQAAGQSPRLTQAQINQVKAALEASGTHPLQLTGLQSSGILAFAKAANEFLDSFTPSTGQFTASQPAASNLANGTTGSGAVVLANTPTLVTPVLGAATGTSLNLGGTGVLATTAATGTGALVHADSATLTKATLNATTSASITNLPIYANNAAAIVGGLAAGNLYRSGGDPDQISVVH